MKALIRWCLIGILAFAALLGVALAGGYAFLQSDSGRAWLVATVNETVSQPGQMEITLEGLSGTIPQDLRLERLTIADGEGPWLELTDLHLDWRPFALLRERLAIETLTLASLRLERLPAPGQTTSQQPKASVSPPSGPPSLPFALELKRIALDEIVLGQPVLGQELRFKLTGDAVSEDSQTIATTVDLTRTDGPESSVRMSSLYHLSEETLDLDLKLTDPKDGFLAVLLDMPDLPPLEAHVTGSGKLSDWSGDLSGELTGWASGDAQFTMKQAEDLAVAFSGGVDITKPGDDPIASLLAGRTNFDVTARLSSDQELNITKLGLNGAPGKITAVGQVNLESLEAAIEAQVDPKDELIPILAGEGLTAQGLRLALKAEGSPSQATARLEVKAEALRASEVAAKTIDITLQTGSVDIDRLAGSFDLEGRVGSLVIDGVPELNDVAGERFDLTLSGHFDMTQQHLEAKDLRVSSDGVQVSANGEVGLSSGDGQANVIVTLADLARLDPFVGLGLKGHGEIKGAIQIRNFGETIDTSLEGNLDGLALDEPVVATLLGQSLSLQAKATYQDVGSLEFSDVALASKHLTIKSAGQISDNFANLQADYQASVPDLSVLSEALGIDLAGAANLDGNASGALENPTIEANLKVEKAAVSGEPLGLVQLTALVADPATAPNGDVRLSAEPSTGPVEISGKFQLQSDVLDVTAIEVSSADTNISGELQLNLANLTARSELGGTIGSLTPWLAFAGLEGGGSGQFDLSMAPVDGRQDAELEAAFQNLRLAPDPATLVKVKSLAITASLQDLLAAPQGRIEATAEAIEQDDLTLTSLSVFAEGSLQDAGFEIATKGEFDEPFAFNTAGRFGQDGTRTTVTLEQLSASLMDEEINLLQPGTVVYDQNLIEVTGLSLSAAGAKINADAKLNDQSISADIRAEQVDLALFTPFVPEIPQGDLSADLNLSGTRSDPAGRFEVRIDDLRHPEAKNGTTSTLTLDGTLNRGLLDVNGRLSGATKQDMELAAKLPLRIDPDSLAVDVPQNEPISGSLQWRGDLAEIWQIAARADDQLSGPGEINMTASGTLDQPRLDGQVTITSGSYENFASGTLLKDLNVEVLLDGEELTLARFSATDAGKGSLSAKGGATLDPDRDFPYQLEANLSSARLVRRDDVTASTSGDLTLEGTAKEASLTGQMTTDRIEIALESSMPSNVVDLEVVEINSTEPQNGLDENGETQESDEPPALQLALDIKINMPRRVFVRGHGLDSEWSGDLRVFGTADKPRIEGTIELVRGQVSQAGLTLTLSRGVITFTGSEDINPLLDIEATNKSAELTATVRIIGTAKDPEVELSSVPAVPEDEIVAHLMFGKGANSLSTFEQVQVAAAVARLTGKGDGGPDIMENLRSALGFDVLRLSTVGEGTDTKSAVTVGKYVTDDVFLGVTQGATADSSSVGVEVELTPNISLESEMGETGDTNLGVRFHWDY